MKLVIGMTSLMLTLGLVWMFWLTPAKTQHIDFSAQMSKQYDYVPPPMGAKEIPSPDKSVEKRVAKTPKKDAAPAAPAPRESGPTTVYQQKMNPLDILGKISPLVSTGITVATFMRGRKRKKR